MKRVGIISNWSFSLKTFPVAHLCLLALTILVIGDTAGWLDINHYQECGIAISFILILSFFGPLLSLYHIDGKSKKYRWIGYGLQLGALLLGALYFFLLIKNDIMAAETATQLLYFGLFPLMFFGIMLYISVLLRRVEENIWIAFSNIIKSVVFGVLAGLIVRGGLSGALASVEALFDVDFSYRRYEYFGSFSMILLAGSFILNYYLLLTENSSIIFPSRIRKIFGSYIIFPLAMVYLVIFLSYAVKILITGEWPKGIIVFLGCGYFSLGLVCYYLTYPEKTPFFEMLRRVLFASFLFVVWMMGCAILKRINQYGLTINRYFVCALVVSIAIFSVLALCYRRKRLLSLVAVFFGAVLISLYGPFKASSMALLSQKSRLFSLLDKNNITLPLGNNSLVNLTGDDARLVAGILDEILYKYGAKTWSGTLISLENFTGNMQGYSLRSEIRGNLGLQPSYLLSEDQYFSFWSSRDSLMLEVNGYSKIYELSLHSSKNVIDLPEYIGGVLDLTPYVDDIYEKSQRNYFPLERENDDKYYVIEEEGRRYIITSMSGIKKSDGSIIITGLFGFLLVK